ncbi:MAG: indolepyruvate ferredoxin oxidoreductase subunit alpha [bacterium]
MKTQPNRELLSGNEAIAYGAYDAGVRVATAYPGTPSTEILESLARFKDVYAEWSPNEKVAMEVAIGASLGGARSLVSMKHVGLNVAADPFFTASYIGVRGGLLIVSADDPGLHSSQNEQDNRHFAVAAKVPMLEPSDSQEAYDFVAVALQMSEQYDTPVLLRVTTRICHSKTVVVRKAAVRTSPIPPAFRKDPPKYVMVPMYARQRHELVERRMEQLADLSESTPLNRVEPGEGTLGIVSSGVAYQYAREAFPRASFLKIGMSHPLPAAKIRAFAEGLKEIAVVEELDPFLEVQVRSLGVPAFGKDRLPLCGELTPEIVSRGLRRDTTLSPGEEPAARRALPPRPPALCPGCPHSATFYTIKKLKLDVMGDIGCYTLSVAPPLETMDTTVCMGASIGMAHGLEKALAGREDGGRPRCVAVLGDSTFLHSGIAPLLNVAYNKGCSTTLILDNRTTAMTGFQEHAGTGRTAQGEEAPSVDFEALGKALGIESVRTVDPYDLKAMEKALREEVRAPHSSLIIARRSCLLLRKGEKRRPKKVDPEACAGCRLCLRIGCPALSETAEGKATIDAAVCNGCPICEQVCKAEAIQEWTPE